MNQSDLAVAMRACSHHAMVDPFLVADDALQKMVTTVAPPSSLKDTSIPGYPIPADEANRLALLAECQILDTPLDPDFDDLTRLASQFCGTPIALISLVDESRQWFKSRVGVDVPETPREIAFCAHAIPEPSRILVVPDATKDSRFADNELVTGDMGIRFYAGAPLVLEGHALGTLCVIDRSPRELTAEQREALAALARQVVRLIRLRRKNLLLQKARVDQEAFFTRPLDMLCVAGADGYFKIVNPAFTDTLGYTSAELLAVPLFDFVHPEDAASVQAQMGRVVSGLHVVDFECRFRCKDGSYRWLSWKCAPAADGVLHASARDVTEQKEMAETLERQRGELRLLFDYLPALIVFKDTRNGLLRVNQRLADSVGKTVAEIEGRTTEEIHPHHAAKYYADDLEVIQSGVPKLGIVETFRDKDDRDVWIQTDKVPVRDARGNVTGLVAMSQDITERKVAEDAVADLARRLQLATDATGAGVWEWKLDGSDLVWDRQMFALYGIEPTAMTYEAWKATVHPDDFPEQERLMAETLRTRGRGERRFRIRRQSDGKERILYAAEMVVCDEAGKPVRLIGVNRDITDQENAAAKLAAQEDLLRQFVRYTPAAVAMLDTEMRYLQASERWIKEYHLEGREIIGRSHYEVFPDLPEQWKEIHRRCLAGAVDRCDEAPFPRADGTIEWLQWEVRPWLKVGDQIGGLIFFTQVITERKRNEALLLASERTIRVTIEHSAIGVAVIALDGRFLQVNRSMCEMVGRTEEEMLGLGIVDITHPDDWPANRAEVATFIASESDHFQTDKRYLHKDGRVVWASVTATAIRDAEGRKIQLLGQVENITKRHEAEERLKASLVEKETLLQEVHHRVKNNLQVVYSLLSLQSDFIQNEQALASFRECQRRIRAMALIHEQLYRSDNLSRVELPDYLETLARTVLGSYSRQGNISLHFALAPVGVSIDSAVPLGLFTNEVLSNALKHAFPGGRSGHIRITLQPGKDDRFTLVIEDDGVGLPEETPEVTDTLGMRLLGMFAKQLRAKFDVDTQPGRTRFRLDCPGVIGEEGTIPEN